MNANAGKTIPEAGFGTCRWCGLEDTRLQFLMCPKCFRISNMVPSKAMVLLNRPDLKRKLGPGGATLINFTPELRDFLLDPSSNFPIEESDIEHFEVMKKESISSVTQKDIKFYVHTLVSEGDYELPETDEELFKIIGLEHMLRFIIRVCVERGLLKVNIDLDEDDSIRDMCEDCLENPVLKEEPEDWKAPRQSDPFDVSTPKEGMKVRDIIMKKYGR